MDLSSRYLGLDLESPFMLGASPLAADLDAVRRVQDAGASAVVMGSLFQEQVASGIESPFYPSGHRDFSLEPDEYMRHVERLKSGLRIPVIGSINCSIGRDWTQYVRMLDRAGADAIEINIYHPASDPDLTSATLEDEVVNTVWLAAEATTIPIAVKLSPYYTSLPNLARRLVGAGAKGLVLFNRFYQTDIDVDKLEVVAQVQRSSPNETALRLRWLAILSAQLKVSLAMTGGVGSPADALKGILAGARAIQLVSQVMQYGPSVFSDARAWLTSWMAQNGHESLAHVRGRMNHSGSLDSEALERASYLRALQGHPTWQMFGPR